jgi:pimeloyl-ACP methyl ester carboxylesterase
MRELDIRGRAVAVAECGAGDPLVYLHGLADVHGAASGFLPFHERLGARRRVLAPAHIGCAGTDEDDSINTIDDVVFHYLEVLDALKLDRFALAGSCIGGWVAAEIAVRHPERVAKLCLLGATGLFVSGKPIADVFWEVLPANGVELRGLRGLLFGDPESAAARDLFPDNPSGARSGPAIDRELMRYKTFRFASRIGFKPPYLYNRKLRERLGRYRGPALILWGESDRMVPLAHARAYAEGLAGSRLEIVKGAGHSVAAERPEEAARLVNDFLGS